MKALVSFVALLVALLCVLVPSNAGAQPAIMPKELEHVGVAEHLDAPLALAARFKDENGRELALGDLFDQKKPRVLVFAYHSCPVLCSMVLKAAVKGLKPVPWKVGTDFDVIVISIDPNETRDALMKRRAMIVADYNYPGAEKGFHFLTGDKTNIDLVANSAGVQYEYDEEQKQFGHPALVMLVKPTGELARYLYGLEFSPNDLRLGLLEASEGRSISTVEQLILYCYHYDPKGGRYVLVAWRVMRLGASACAVVLFGVLALFWRREAKKRRAKKLDEDDTETKLPPATGAPTEAPAGSPS
jgi:protein SCO1/2